MRKGWTELIRVHKTGFETVDVNLFKKKNYEENMKGLNIWPYLPESSNLLDGNVDSYVFSTGN